MFHMVFIVLVAVIALVDSQALFKTGLAVCGEGEGSPILLDTTSSDFSQATVLSESVGCYTQPPLTSMASVMAAQVQSTAIKGQPVHIEENLIVPCSPTNLAVGFIIIFPLLWHDNLPAYYVPMCLDPSAFQPGLLGEAVYCLYNSPSTCWPDGGLYSLYTLDARVAGPADLSEEGVSLSTPQGTTTIATDPFTWTNSLQITSFLVSDGLCPSCGGDSPQSADTVSSAFSSYLPPHYISQSSLDTVVLVHNEEVSEGLPCSSFQSPIQSMVGQSYFCGLMLGAPLSSTILECNSTQGPEFAPEMSPNMVGYGVRDSLPTTIRTRISLAGQDEPDQCGMVWSVGNQSQPYSWADDVPAIIQEFDDDGVDDSGFTFVAPWYTLLVVEDAIIMLSYQVVGGHHYTAEWTFQIPMETTADFVIRASLPDHSLLAIAYRNCSAYGYSNGRVCHLSQPVYVPPGVSGEITFEWAQIQVVPGFPELRMGTFSLIPDYDTNCRWDHIGHGNVYFTPGERAPLIRLPKRRSAADIALGLALPGVGNLLFASTVAKALKKIVRAMNAENVLVKTSLATIDFFLQFTMHIASTKPLLVSFDDNLQDIQVFQTLAQLDSDILFSVASSWVVGQIVQLNGTYYQVATLPPLITLNPVAVCPVYGNGSFVGAEGVTAIGACIAGYTGSAESGCSRVECSSGTATISSTCQPFKTNLLDQAIVADITNGETVSHFTGSILQSIASITANLSVSLGSYVTLPSLNGIAKDLNDAINDITHPFSLPSLKGFGSFILYAIIIGGSIFMVITVSRVLVERKPNGSVSPIPTRV